MNESFSVLKEKSMQTPNQKLLLRLEGGELGKFSAPTRVREEFPFSAERLE